MATLKILSENYPGRLHRAFAVDPPSIFPYIWKVLLPFPCFPKIPIRIPHSHLQFQAARPFVDLWRLMTVISSSEIKEEKQRELIHKSPSLRFDPSPISSSSSSRFSFTVSQIDSLKPWILTSSPSLSARSFSFADRSTPPPATKFFSRKPQQEGHPSDSFKPLLKFFRCPYNETQYRAKIKQFQSQQKCTPRTGKFQIPK